MMMTMTTRARSGRDAGPLNKSVDLAARTGAILLSALTCLPASAQESFDCEVGKAAFLTSDNIAVFDVEIADDAAERARGLMFREELSRDAGMLFVYDDARPVSFWMRNTLISLDLVFMDETGVIRHIHENAVPLDETPIPGALPDDPEPERSLILEIGGGLASAFGLEPGQPMASPKIDQSLAAWPCR